MARRFLSLKMNQTIIFFLFIMVNIISLTTSLDESICSCTCCKGNNCKATFQDEFPLDSCDIEYCMQKCAVNYDECALFEGEGDVRARCDKRRSF
ncbi:unnamed protein product [Adineta ricciae]|uniref:Uncharacterized protein n=1 Tax=Adineta ricciae TaxID=249248 RepID=A0A814W5C7_ADIRI|nr:unnamed protein product [Adineta ricciae]